MAEKPAPDKQPEPRTFEEEFGFGEHRKAVAPPIIEDDIASWERSKPITTTPPATSKSAVKWAEIGETEEGGKPLRIARDDRPEFGPIKLESAHYATPETGGSEESASTKKERHGRRREALPELSTWEGVIAIQTYENGAEKDLLLFFPGNESGDFGIGQRNTAVKKLAAECKYEKTEFPSSRRRGKPLIFATSTDAKALSDVFAMAEKANATLPLMDIRAEDMETLLPLLTQYRQIPAEQRNKFFLQKIENALQAGSSAISDEEESEGKTRRRPKKTNVHTATPAPGIPELANGFMAWHVPGGDVHLIVKKQDNLREIKQAVLALSGEALQTDNRYNGLKYYVFKLSDTQIEALMERNIPCIDYQAGALDVEACVERCKDIERALATIAKPVMVSAQGVRSNGTWVAHVDPPLTASPTPRQKTWAIRALLDGAFTARVEGVTLKQAPLKDRKKLIPVVRTDTKNYIPRNARYAEDEATETNTGQITPMVLCIRKRELPPGAESLQNTLAHIWGLEGECVGKMLIIPTKKSGQSAKYSFFHVGPDEIEALEGYGVPCVSKVAIPFHACEKARRQEKT